MNSEIQHRDRARQIIDFAGIRLGAKGMPTDCDGLIEWHNKAYVFFEIKHRHKHLPDGQKLAFVRMCDNTVAAEQYRTHQARKIIGSIEIEYIKSDTPEHLTRSRFFVNTVSNAPKVQGQYATIDVAFSNEDYRNIVLKEAYRELKPFQLKYNSYQELSDVFKAINAFGDTLK